MIFIKHNPMKFLSVKLPIWGGVLLGLLPIVIEKSMNTGLIPAEYHTIFISIVLPTLAYFGRGIYQPELHEKQEQESE